MTGNRFLKTILVLTLGGTAACTHDLKDGQNASTKAVEATDTLSYDRYVAEQQILDKRYATELNYANKIVDSYGPKSAAFRQAADALHASDAMLSLKIATGYDKTTAGKDTTVYRAFIEQSRGNYRYETTIRALNGQPASWWTVDAVGLQ